ncbi:GNVR domain-containing protein [Pseudomonas gessardii]|uniref:GNVR domain-containing protein n=1 Tax=Pseudomonas gessardii TaxID=78544 RepID=UPI001475D683|nr:chain-length determining protein [Pseudomonas gessardii]
MSSSFQAPSVSSSDEVDLYAIYRTLLQQKALILFVTFLIGAVVSTYALLVSPEYQVSSVLRPAAINELDALNRSEIYQLPPGEALMKVGASLESYETRLGFFRANQKLFSRFERPGRTLEQSFEEFNYNSINLVVPDSKKTGSLSDYIKLEMNYPEGVDGVAILNGFVQYAIASQRQQISADMEVIVKNRLSELSGKLDAARSNYDTDKAARIATLSEADHLKRAQLQDELKALRAQLKTQRADRVAQLNEAIGIARSLGIQKPTTPASLGEGGASGNQPIMRTEVNNQPIPLYFMGVDALLAEQRALLQRKSDDFTDARIAQIAKELQLLQANREVDVLKQRQNEDLFLGGVQSLRAEEARLNNLNVDMSGLKLVTIDKEAIEPLSPIKPKKVLIIIVGLVFGLILGLLAAFVRGAVAVQKRRQSGSCAVLVPSSSVPAKKVLPVSVEEV